MCNWSRLRHSSHTLGFCNQATHHRSTHKREAQYQSPRAVLTILVTLRPTRSGATLRASSAAGFAAAAAAGAGLDQTKCTLEGRSVSASCWKTVAAVVKLPVTAPDTWQGYKYCERLERLLRQSDQGLPKSGSGPRSLTSLEAVDHLGGARGIGAQWANYQIVVLEPLGN